MDPDRKLAERTAAGDERAFAELVERHREPLLHYVARRFNPELAEDAVQEALLSAHRAIVGGTVPVDTRAWLCTIAWRRALDLTRRERDALPLDSAVAGSADDPEARAIQANELGRVVAAFTELPVRQRKALALSALEGRSLEEIGDALDVAPDTAKSLVARSRRTLTHRLAAAELDCGTARLEMESAATRGVRLRGDITLHVQSCKACARAHRAIRRRRRVRCAAADRVPDPDDRDARPHPRSRRLQPGVGGAGRRGEDVHGGVLVDRCGERRGADGDGGGAARRQGAADPGRGRRRPQEDAPPREADADPHAEADHHAAADPGLDGDAQAGRCRRRPSSARRATLPTPMVGGGMSEDDGAPKAVVRETPTATPVVTPVPTVAAG